MSAWPPFPACELRGLTAAGVPVRVKHWVAWDDGNVRSDKVSGKVSKQTSLFSGLLGLDLVWWWGGKASLVPVPHHLHGVQGLIRRRGDARELGSGCGLRGYLKSVNRVPKNTGAW